MAARQATARTKRVPDADVIDVGPAPDPALELIEQDRPTIQSFLAGLAPFFTRAGELERKAQDYEREAQQLVAPADAAHDARIQTFIKVGAGAKKAVLEHWGVCQALSALHRKLTGRRAIAVDALERGMQRAQQLHNAYVETERRRAQEEEARLRREQEERARQEREAELARMEQEALAREEASADLSDRERAFVDAYVHGIGARGDAVTAATRAGFKDPQRAAARLLSLPKIQAAVTAKQEAIAIREQQQAVARKPLEVDTAAVTVRPNVQKVGTDRTTYAAEVLDADALLAAVLDPVQRMKLGIPTDVLTVDQVRLNDYARQMHELINRWPGVRLKKNTRTV